jgi:hypothetical protein
VASGKGGVGKSTVAALRASHWRWPKRARGSACSTPTSTAPTCRRCSAARAAPSWGITVLCQSKRVACA